VETFFFFLEEVGMQKTDETTHRHPNGIFPKEKLRAGVWNG
jgi:hypothetical protein